LNNFEVFRKGAVPAVLLSVLFLLTGCKDVTAADLVTYAVAYFANGGDGSMDSIAVAEESTITLPLCPFTLTSHAFAGWSTLSGGAVDYSEGDSFDMHDADVTLYAVWTPVYHSITFDANGGSGTMANMTVLEDTSVSLAPCSFLREQYVFCGWATASEGTGSYADGETFPMGDSDVTLYAVWEVSLEPTWASEVNGGGSQLLPLRNGKG